MDLDTLMDKFMASNPIYAKRLARDPNSTIFGEFKETYYFCLEDYKDPYEFFSEIFSRDELDFLVDIIYA